MAANDGFGVVLQKNISSTWTTIAQLQDVTGPSRSKSVYQSTTKGSASRTHEYESGLRDSGEVTIAILYDPSLATHLALLADYNADTNADYRVAYADGSSYGDTFKAIVTNFVPNGPMDGLLSADVTLKITGVITNGVLA
jgi:hypothetical protein